MRTRRLSGSFVAVACALAVLGGFASTASSAMPRGVHPFEAHLRDAQVCRGGTFCGTGTLAGFGAIKTRLAVGPIHPGPAKGCLDVAGTRTLTLASDRKSTLRLSARGAACGSHAWGTFKVVSGSGVFARATGSGVIVGTLTQTRPLRESLRYSGVLTLRG